MDLHANYFIRDIALKNRSMLEIDEALHLHYLLKECSSLAGEVVELGCYRGLTGVILRKTLDIFAPSKKLYLFDSFQGLPPKSKEDELSIPANKTTIKDNKRISEGWFATSIESVYDSFQAYNVKLPIVVPGWFSETLPKQLPESICFAHLDGDFYTSIYESLEAVYPKLVENAIVVIDDYCDPLHHEKINAYPGVKKACDAFLQDKQETISLLASRNGYQGFFIKKTPR